MDDRNKVILFWNGFNLLNRGLSWNDLLKSLTKKYEKILTDINQKEYQTINEL